MKEREEAKQLIRNKPEMLVFRSCWKCNEAHEHLKKSEAVINCFVCGKYFYKGKDVTDYGK